MKLSEFIAVLNFNKSFQPVCCSLLPD